MAGWYDYKEWIRWPICKHYRKAHDRTEWKRAVLAAINVVNGWQVISEGEER